MNQAAPGNHAASEDEFCFSPDCADCHDYQQGWREGRTKLAEQVRDEMPGALHHVLAEAERQA